MIIMNRATHLIEIPKRVSMQHFGRLGWTPEDGHQGWREEGYSIPTHLKGKGRARLHGPNEGGATPEERDSPGCGSPQPGSPANVCVLLP